MPQFHVQLLHARIALHCVAQKGGSTFVIITLEQLVQFL